MIPLGNSELWNVANKFAVKQRRQWAGDMDTETLNEWQFTNLRQTIEYCRERSPFYQRHFADLGATAPIDSLPFTSKKDLRQHLDDVGSAVLDVAAGAFLVDYLQS